MTKSKRYLKNLKQYKTFLKTGTDYDFSSFYMVQQIWLESYVAHVKKCNMGNYLSNEVKTAKEAIECLKVLREDNFCKEENKAHDKKWGKLKSKFGKEIGQAREYILYRSKAKTDKQKKQERKEQLVIYDLEAKRHKNSFETFIKLMSENLEKWWC